ncbi:MAG TPA: GntR family transcriptional regulator [Tepidisphaeraceae bacterium]|nr:GntR family transcriptional regulator [Tepidisphaeraceae bacterium]
MLVRIESSSGVPITRQIADQIRAGCASGSLRPGDRLPSVRELARQITVNQNTVLRVYERLTAEGLLERRHGDGTYVSDDLPGGQLKQQRAALRDDLRRLVERAHVLGYEPDQLHHLLDRTIAESEAQSSAALEKRS